MAERGRSTILLHIGGQKCGSSALQGYFFFGRKALARHNIHYLDREFGIDLAKAGSHNALLTQLAAPEGADFVRRGLSKLPMDDPERVYVLSSEGFSSVRKVTDLARTLSCLQEFGNVRILHYIRHQAEVLYSGWQQWGPRYDFPDWVEDALERRFADWALVQREWRRALPAAEVTTRIFAREQMPDGDIVEDLRQVLPFPVLRSPKKDTTNPSYDDATVMALQSLERAAGLRPRTLIRHLKRSGVLFEKTSRNLVFPPEMQDRVRRIYDDSNAELAAMAGLDGAQRQSFNTLRLRPYEAPDGGFLDMVRRRVSAQIGPLEALNLSG